MNMRLGTIIAHVEKGYGLWGRDAKVLSDALAAAQAENAALWNAITAVEWAGQGWPDKPQLYERWPTVVAALAALESTEREKG